MTGVDLELTGRAAPVLTAQERAQLAALADILIPEAHGMPSASRAQVPTRWADDTLRLRPEMLPVLQRALSSAQDDDPSSGLRRLAAEDLEAFEVLGAVVAGSYYMSPEVRRLIGYPGQEARALVDDTDQYLDMLERVVDRGPVYRPTPA